MKSLLILAAILMYCGCYRGRAQTVASNTGGVLVIVVTGLHSNKGRVSVALFNKEAAFPKSTEKAVGIIYSKIDHNKSIAEFDGLPAGEYAISVYHDENDNKKMDTNIFGIPKEGVGASNDARDHFGPPKYRDAKFIFNGSTKTVSVSIVYL